MTVSLTINHSILVVLRRI